MEFDKNSMQKLLSLDDESFKTIAQQIVEAVGADQRKAEAMLSDIGGLKKNIAKMSPENAEKLINAAGKEKSEEIYKIIKGGK